MPAGAVLCSRPHVGVGSRGLPTCRRWPGGRRGDVDRGVTGSRADERAIAPVTKPPAVWGTGGGDRVVFLLSAPLLFGMMHTSEEWGVGTLPFRVNAMFQLPLALSIVYTAALRGAGDTRFPLVAHVAGFRVRLPLAWWAGMEMGGGCCGRGLR
ncbi:MAG: hypothetical protein Ct9H300mP1_19910 [Planctomycetaceae bacterium]|nr:MAG: hypothetical protein Ct9H300mP1_19910 [Planctomycetaceae bacterium]